MPENDSNRNEPTQHVDADVQRGRALLKAGNHRQALALAEKLIAQHGEICSALQLAGETHFARANFVASERIARRCEELYPADPGGPILRCRALLALGRIGEARDVALEAAEKDIIDDNHVEILAMVLAGCMVPESAYPLCKNAVARDPYNAAAHRRLALNCRLIGRVDEAVEAANIALRFDAHDYEMLGLRSSLCKVTRDDNHVVELETLLSAGCRSPLGAAQVAYALAKEYEDLGDYERSFAHTQTGAKLKRGTMRYDVAQDVAIMRDFEDIYTADALDNDAPGYFSSEPIFILGLPRTGSTLIERVLSSHTDIYAAGELQHLGGAFMEEVRKLGAIVDRRDIARKTLHIDPEAVGQSYIERSRPFTGHTPHFIDKLPNNFLHVGIIHRALPDAKIIHVRRTPMDACYAAYKFLFNQSYGWSYDLDDIAKHYVAYRRLMDHWRSVLPGRMIEVAYEDVVTDIEGTARRLIENIGLDWQPACVDFHENPAAAMTGSAVQVRQKLYADSVGRWRNYEAQLAPLAAALKQAGIDPYTP